MKRWIGLLVLALLLGGCAGPTNSAPADIANSATSTPANPNPGAPETDIPDVLSVSWEILDRDYAAIAPMGEDLLLFGDGVLAKYSAGSITVQISASIPLPTSGRLQITDSAIHYFDAVQNALVTLNADLQEIRRLPVPETVQGDPYLSADGNLLYYCTPNGIRLWDVDTGITRNLKIHPGEWLGISHGLYDGNYLVCQLQQADHVRTMLIRADTGETVYEGDILSSVTGNGPFYFCTTANEQIFGYWDQQPQNLFIDNVIPLPDAHLAVTADTVSTGLHLKLYNLDTGLQIASEVLPEATTLTAPIIFQGNLVFLSGNRLYQWYYDISSDLYPVEDETHYTAYRFTAAAPDTAGLAALQERADALSGLYGIQILLWQDAAAAEPDGYAFEIEYRTQIYENCLDRLEVALAQFPADFFKTAGSWTDDGTIRLVLLRSFTPPENACGGQYLLDWNVYIPLTLDEDMEQRLYHGLGHTVDTLILSRCDAFYEWHTVNPSGFEYTNDYTGWQDRDSKYLHGSRRYFVNALSMTFPAEDRATLLEYAILPGNEAIFESQHMQTKLLRLKTGLREAFGLTEDGYPWEQYLQ